LTDDDFLKANVEATQSIDIVDFVDAGDISPMYFDKPYYLAPRKSGQRGYALLLEVMKRRGKAGIARVVIRSRQHLAALLAEGPRLILNLLRFSHELRDPATLALPATNAPPKSNQELRLAEELVESMAAKWNPKKYRDEYRQDLLRMIEKKVEAGQTKAIEPAAPVQQPKSNGKVVDIMHLLRRSMKQVSKKTPSSRGRRAS
jgi:DNA end-binding protein Ku